MILVASTVETNLVNTGLLRTLGDQPPDDRRRRLVAAVRVLRADLRVERARRRQRRAARVVDHLRVDVLRTPEDGQAGPLRRADEPAADVPLAAQSSGLDLLLLIVHRAILCSRGSGAADADRPPSPLGVHLVADESG